MPGPQRVTVALLQLAGGVVAAAGLLLSLLCLARFVQRRTTVLPERDASSLVVRGPYRYSRNPMYLSLLLSYVGLCVQIGWPWALLLLPLLALQRVLIPFEEARLRERFGSAYARYCTQVRRWL
ncbi:methyltransferase family protein [Xanthomonas translucens]|uniref:methyltransferase family protein n=1 Tax=Xanthomonas campestris pv. translucens TaxID=343 RepID=UPI0019D565C9|nr:isoprenylcysteine carboxylmethyltransferase family protein [Xanthomonas translucens]QSQ30074.1 isoprenylcysteine carboxylmethyltransferase family protein [Xanthomonas translucens pv. translucens]